MQENQERWCCTYTMTAVSRLRITARRSDPFNDSILFQRAGDAGANGLHQFVAVLEPAGVNRLMEDYVRGPGLNADAALRHHVRRANHRDRRDGHAAIHGK